MFTDIYPMEEVEDGLLYKVTGKVSTTHPENFIFNLCLFFLVSLTCSTPRFNVTGNCCAIHLLNHFYHSKCDTDELTRIV